ncbi:hypothetical protein B0A52_02893 [Exophiala mesophila]|uniref:Uncharacterized protein n=1 Tax=Exophiala mesophila TaxID=212818 RepID=A0A438NDY4_EXOME|nr:hypothetical protein B0A52_02893 [Exophiala mesophila]
MDSVSQAANFTSIEQRPVHARLFHLLKCRFLSWLGLPVPSNLVPHHNGNWKGMGPYLLIEYIDETRGQRLSDTWEIGRVDPRLRKNLFRGLAQTMLRMARIPFPRIGSLIIDNDGFLRLANRPLTSELQDLESEGIPLDIPRNRTYDTVGAYIDELLHCHDSRLRYQPNSVFELGDAVSQMAAHATLRTVRADFFRRDLNEGPFTMQLTDMNRHNIIVDRDWNLTCHIDLEWTAILPQEFMQPPLWLTNQAVDTLDVDAYNKLREEFMQAMEEEEKNRLELRPLGKHALQLSSIMNVSWDRGTFWIQPLYSRLHRQNDQFCLILFAYWARQSHKFMNEKVNQKEEYDKKLLEAFQT